jgi:hypothetical protein
MPYDIPFSSEEPSTFQLVKPESKRLPVYYQYRRSYRLHAHPLYGFPDQPCDFDFNSKTSRIYGKTDSFLIEIIGVLTLIRTTLGATCLTSDEQL